MSNYRKTPDIRWALTHGVMGRMRPSLSPSYTALSQHSYLGAPDFMRMLGVALLAHIMVMVGMAMWPRERVTEIPVRAITFRLGEATVLALPEPPPAEKIAPEAEVNAQPKNQTPAEPKPAAKPKTVPVPEPVRQMPVENASAGFLSLPARYMPSEQPSAEETQKRSLLERSPKQYIRQYGLPSVENIFKDNAIPKATIKELTEVAPTVLQGVANTAQNDAASVRVTQGEGAGAKASGEGEDAESVTIIRQRYEQQISAWIAKHKVYPATAAGKVGRVVVRMRIDRQGYVRYYALEESSDVPALDKAAMDMIRRANPVPTPPRNYPAGNLIEFLIPITFEKP